MDSGLDSLMELVVDMGLGEFYSLRQVMDQLVLIVKDEWAWQGLELVMGYMSYY